MAADHTDTTDCVEVSERRMKRAKGKTLQKEPSPKTSTVHIIRQRNLNGVAAKRLVGKRLVQSRFKDIIMNPWFFILSPGIVSVVMTIPFLASLNEEWLQSLDEAIVENINDAAGAYLSIAGLVYSLLITQLLSQAHTLLAQFEDTSCNEAACLVRALRLVSMLHHAQKESEVSLRLTEIVKAYAHQVRDELSAGRQDSHDDLSARPMNTLFNALVLMPNLMDVPLGSLLVPRLCDAIEDAVHKRICRFMQGHQRAATKNMRLLLDVLAIFQFVGILFLRTGSAEIDLTFCSLIATSITFSLALLHATDNKKAPLAFHHSESLFQIDSMLSDLC